MEMKQTTKVQDIQMHAMFASSMEMMQTTEVKDIQDLLDIVTYIKQYLCLILWQGVAKSTYIIRMYAWI